jgi:hypothetical protein
VPLAANMLGTPAAERVLFSRNKASSFQIQQPGAAPTVIPFGLPSDDPILGDWDGNGTANVGVRRPSDNLFYLSGPGGTTSLGFGLPTDKPIAGDWNGDGRTDLGVHRSSTGQFMLRGPDGSVSPVALGDANDIPVTGDWDGNRVTDVGVYDSATATFTLRFVSANGTLWVGNVVFGLAGDLPVVGDWDGNGVTDLGVWRPGTGSFYGRRAPSARATTTTVSEVRFGRPRLTS